MSPKKHMRSISLFLIVIMICVYLFPGAAYTSELKTGSALFNFSDPRNDDHGKGDITYPNDRLFQPGMLDLIHVNAVIKQKNVIVNARFREKIAPPPQIKITDNLMLQDLIQEDFYAFNLDFYIQIPELNEHGITWLLPGRKAELAAGFRWDRAIVFTPLPRKARIELISMIKKGIIAQDRSGISSNPITQKKAKKQALQFVRDHVYFVEKAILNGPTIQADIPKNWFGPDLTVADWKITACVTAASFTNSLNLINWMMGNRIEGNLFVRPIQPIGDPGQFGGGSGISGESNLIDILVPEGFTQENLLNRFSKTQVPRIRLLSLKQSGMGNGNSAN